MVRVELRLRWLGSLDERTSSLRIYGARQLCVWVGSGSDPHEIQLSESPERLTMDHELEADLFLVRFELYGLVGWATWTSGQLVLAPPVSISGASGLPPATRTRSIPARTRSVSRRTTSLSVDFFILA